MKWKYQSKSDLIPRFELFDRNSFRISTDCFVANVYNNSQSDECTPIKEQIKTKPKHRIFIEFGSNVDDSHLISLFLKIIKNIWSILLICQKSSEGVRLCPNHEWDHFITKISIALVDFGYSNGIPCCLFRNHIKMTSTTNQIAMCQLIILFQCFFFAFRSVDCHKMSRSVEKEIKSRN